MGKLGLYIHIPFCKKKCLYCDFPSYGSMEGYMMDYTRALCMEIEKKAQNNKFDTIFIGGGTPSYLSSEALKLLGNTLSNIDKAENLEFTMECNPGTFHEEKLRLMKDIGVNRLSIGLQAYQNRLLKELGRIHSFNDFLSGFKLAREIGFNNINVDLMFALPNQSFEDWKETLHNVVKLNPEHLSCYSLIIEEGTPFYKMNLEGKLKLPEEETEMKMYEYTVKYLKENMYKQYEISNYSKEGKECRHNLIYWELNEYIGCGASAHSYFKGIRNINENNVKRYINKSLRNVNTSIESYVNSREDDIEEFMFLGFRKISGVSIQEFEKRFGISIYSVYKKVIDKHLRQGLLVVRNGRIFLSAKGIEISNTVMSDFILTR